ncbi:MAG: MerR family transcriptional regulator [Janthinobacterium lividum]
MNDIPNSDSLLWEALPDLTLNIAQTATLCSISVRQLGYWTRQGYVAAQGRGVRRTYGLQAIRQVLAIRKAMDTGSSLRQSLRLVSADTAGDADLPDTALMFRPPPARPVTDGLLPAQATALSRSLVAFFQANCHTRDHAGGLAVKLGWAEEDVRVVADRLCASGILIQNFCQGMTIFQSAEQGITGA